MADLYSSGDPSILRLISLVLEAGGKYNIPVTVCGQMSSDPKFLPLLLGLGLRQISLTRHAIPELKEIIRNISIPHEEAISEHV